MRGADRSIVAEVREIALAAELVRLGARPQVLEAETSLSRERIVRLYQEIAGAAPPRGMLSFTVNWYNEWRPNVHASLFHGIYRFIVRHAHEGESSIRSVLQSYRLYLEQAGAHGEAPVLSVTRAWMLVRFIDSGALRLHDCMHCGGRFVGRSCGHQGSCAGYVCGFCQPRPRAGNAQQRGHHAPCSCM